MQRSDPLAGKWRENTHGEAGVCHSILTIRVISTKQTLAENPARSQRRPMTRGLKKPGRTLNIAVPRTGRRSRELNTTLGEPPHHVGVLLPFQLTRAGYVSPRCALVALIELGARG